MLLNSDRYIIALPTFEQILGYSNFYDAETYDRISPYYRNAIRNINILPIKSDPTSGDGDNDGILDIDEKWNGIDERYMNIDPLKEDTVESLYPELKMKKYNSVYNPIYIKADKNNLTFYISTDLNKSADYKTNLKDAGDKTYKEIIEEAIKSKWEGKYKGNKYDFNKGINVNIEIKFISDLRSNNVEFNIFEDSNQRPFVSFINWKPSSRLTVNLFSYIPNSKSFHSVKSYSKYVAHEFGHIMGLDDAYYDIKHPERDELTQCLKTEDYRNDCFKEKYELWGDFGIMQADMKYVSPNDIEMILLAFCENDMQYYRMYNDFSLSKAIKSPYIIYSKREDEAYFFYYLDEQMNKINIGDKTMFDGWTYPDDSILIY